MQGLQTSAYHVTVSSVDAEKDNCQSSKKFGKEGAGLATKQKL